MIDPCTYSRGLSAIGGRGTDLISSVVIFMSSNLVMPLRDQLERQVQSRTGRRIRNLAIELNPARVILRGHASSSYLKQLAHHAIQECLPDLSLENTIALHTPFPRSSHQPHVPP